MEDSWGLLCHCDVLQGVVQFWDFLERILKTGLVSG